MTMANQRAYLEAMDIPVWVRKERADQVPDFVSPGLKLGPGSGQVLLVCAGIDEPARRIASDIARSLNVEPVWAWPEEGAATTDIKALVTAQLFTTVLVFGEGLAADLFNSRMPETLGSARLLKTSSLQELEASPGEKRKLWNLIKKSRLNC